MNSEDKHIFVETSVPENLSGTFKRRWTCTRCNLEKLQSRRSKMVVIYSRSKICFSEGHIPYCFGDTPINEQTIDR